MTDQEIYQKFIDYIDNPVVGVHGIRAHDAHDHFIHHA